MGHLTIFNITMELWGIVFCLIAIAGMRFVLDNMDRKIRRLIVIVNIDIIMLLSDIGGWVFDGSESTVGGVIMRLSNLILYCSNYLMIAFCTRYIYDDMEEKAGSTAKLCNKIVSVLTIVGILIILISQKFNWIYGIDSENTYFRGDWFWISQILGMICILLMYFMVAKDNKTLTVNQKKIYLSFLTALGGALFIQLFYYGLSILNIVETIAVICLVAYNMLAKVHEGNRNKILLQRKKLEAEKQAQELERTAQKLRENQTEALISQIQPHFIFNSLLVIRSLCYEDPEKAIDAINHFSKYLRICLDSLNNEKLISLEKELELSENYLYMEKLRFESAVTFHKDIQTESFRIPALTIQPLLENAVKHGLRQKKMVGSIWLTVKKEGDENVIIVRDNGVGFDVNNKPDDGRNHVGLRNVSLRLQYLCNGSVDIKSRPDYGTEVTIRIPEEDTSHELSDC